MHSHMTKDLDNRLAAVEGHIAAIRRMLAEGRDCDELLLQLKAAESSVSKVSKIILQDHLTHCGSPEKSALYSGVRANLTMRSFMMKWSTIS